MDLSDDERAAREAEAGMRGRAHNLLDQFLVARYRNSGVNQVSSPRSSEAATATAVAVVVVVVSHIQRIGCQPEKNYFTRWPIPLVVC